MSPHSFHACNARPQAAVPRRQRRRVRARPIVLGASPLSPLPPSVPPLPRSPRVRPPTGDDSPYPEVRSAIANTDDPDMPVNAPGPSASSGPSSPLA